MEKFLTHDPAGKKRRERESSSEGDAEYIAGV